MENRPTAPRSLGDVRRKAVAPTSLVEAIQLGEKPLPLMITPTVDGVDLADWIRTHREELDAHFDRHGAILFRGFPLESAKDFEQAASAIVPDLFAEYGDLPQEPSAERIYFSTPYPADKMIMFHNESAHLPQWPLRQFFYCVTPAEEGGTTPLLDCREVYEKLDSEIVEQFEIKGLMYVRNFSPGIDVSWQDFFKTEDREAVERMCAEGGMTCEWTGEDSLRVKHPSPGILTHPRTGEKLFFNQVQIHHVACLDKDTRESLRLLFAEEDMPRNVYYGDGTLIPDDTMERIGEVYEDLCVEFAWESGDMIAVDNMLVSHARRPFSGERKILVAMGEMVNEHDMEPEPVAS